MPPWVRQGQPEVKGQPQVFDGPRGQNKPEEKGKQSAIVQNEKGQWVDRKSGQPVDISAAPQGGGSNNVGQGDLPFGVDASLPAPQGRGNRRSDQYGNRRGDQGMSAPGGGQQGGGGWQRQDNQGQQFLDNMQRNFEMMTPQQRMQNAGQFQADMDKWQSQFGEGGNTRDQVALFDQIKEGTGSQRLRGFPSQNNPMQFTDQQRQGTFRGTDARLQQPQQPQMQAPAIEESRRRTRVAQLENLRLQAQGKPTTAGTPHQNPLWKQKITDDMSTRKKNQIANARYEHYKPTMEVGRTDGLNKVQRNARLNNQRSNQNRQSQGAFTPSQYNPSVASQALS